MSLQVSITVSGDKRVLQKMRRLGSSLYDFSDEMDDIGEQGAKYFSGPAWLSQGGVFGEKWPALSPRTLRRRRQAVGTRGAQPLTTGHPDGMQFSFDYSSGKQVVTIFNNKSYFGYHQSTAERRRLPRRQMIGVSSGFRKIVQTVLKEGVRRKIDNA